MYSFVKDQHCFLVYLLPSPPLIPKATQMQCDEEGSRLAVRLAIATYNMAEPKPKISDCRS